MNGRINSFQSMGAVDGPGIRFVIFMQGCQLRCGYCHNPETWELSGGEEYTVEEVLRKAMRCRPYFGEKGGVTVSGGEPLLQWQFVAELFRSLKVEGIHTVLDTSGIGSPEGAEAVLQFTDLVLCDLKFSTEEDYRRYCKGSLDQVLSFLNRTEQMKIPLWIRHVVVPGLIPPEKTQEIVKMATQFSNLQKFQPLPFKKLCLSKYEAMGIPFPLVDYPECTDKEIEDLPQSSE